MILGGYIDSERTNSKMQKGFGKSMKMKRILSAIMALAVALCCLCLPGGEGGFPELSVSAGAEATGGISVSAASVRRGETFDVIVNVPAVDEIADTIEVRIMFDPTMFEITEWNPRVSGTVEKNLSNDDGFAILASASSNYSLRNGLTITAKARAKSNAVAGKGSFKLLFVEVKNFETGYKWIPATTEAFVKVVDKIVSVSGAVTLKTAGTITDNATVTVTDSTGKSTVKTVSLTLTGTDQTTGINSYGGTYEFDEAESGETYTVTTEVPGFIKHTENVTVGSTAVTNNMSMQKLGDVDGDGRLGAGDATQILKYTVGDYSLIQGADGELNKYLLSVACVEGGTTLSSRDATMILRKVARYSSVLDSIYG